MLLLLLNMERSFFPYQTAKNELPVLKRHEIDHVFILALKNRLRVPVDTTFQGSYWLLGNDYLTQPNYYNNQTTQPVQTILIMSINYQRKLVTGNQRDKAMYKGVLKFNLTYSIQLNNCLLKPRLMR